MRVFLIPVILVGVAALRFAYVRHKHPEAAEDAAGSFRSNLFVVVFIVYRTGCPHLRRCLRLSSVFRSRCLQ